MKEYIYKEPKKYRTLNLFGALVAMVLIVDLIGFGLWVISGQTPPDDMFIGGMTAKVIEIIKK